MLAGAVKSRPWLVHVKISWPQANPSSSLPVTLNPLWTPLTKNKDIAAFFLGKVLATNGSRCRVVVLNGKDLDKIRILELGNCLLATGRGLGGGGLALMDTLAVHKLGGLIFIVAQCIDRSPAGSIVAGLARLCWGRRQKTIGTALRLGLWGLGEAPGGRRLGPDRRRGNGKTGDGGCLSVGPQQRWA